jgi:hypothetical protein
MLSRNLNILSLPSCSLLDGYWRFGGICCIHLHGIRGNSWWQKYRSTPNQSYMQPAFVALYRRKLPQSHRASLCYCIGRVSVQLTAAVAKSQTSCLTLRRNTPDGLFWQWLSWFSSVPVKCRDSVFISPCHRTIRRRIVWTLTASWSNTRKERRCAMKTYAGVEVNGQLHAPAV